MALSIMQEPFGAEWPLGFIGVASPGTPVNIMSLVDPSNNNSPGAATGPTINTAGATKSPTCHKVFFQGYRPGANNNGMVFNTGNVYIMRSLGPGNQNSGGPGNRSDSGAMVYVLYSGSFATLPANEFDGATISPYRYSVDADTAGDGALVTLVGCAR